MVDLVDERSEELKKHWLDVEKYIENELGFKIKNFLCGVNDGGSMVQFEIKEQRFLIDQKKIIESTFDSGYAHHLVTRRMESGFSNDEFFNMSLQDEVSEVLKEENISKIRKYIKDALQNYVSYLIELEGHIKFKNKDGEETNEKS